MIPNLKNIKKGTQQITKVMKGNMIVWENWKPWSYTERKPSSGYSSNYINDYYSSTVDVSNIKIASVSAWGYCQTSGSERACNVTIQGYYDGSWHDLAKSSTENNESFVSWNNTGFHIEKLRAKKGGLALQSAVEITITGFQKGN